MAQLLVADAIGWHEGDGVADWPRQETVFARSDADSRTHLQIRGVGFPWCFGDLDSGDEATLAYVGDVGQLSSLGK